jgi:DNA adenine methylase
VSYLGAKSGAGVYQAIIALMPPHDTYVELFAGSGQILRRKPPAAQSFAVDLNAKALEKIPDRAGLVKSCQSVRSYLDGFDWGGSGRVLIYADPPYVHSTRTSAHRYRFEMTDADHLDLLAQLRCVPASVILSGYPSALYDRNLPGWRSREFQAMTRGGVRTECLWFNFDPSSAHWHTFAGRDFTDRQRIKRKAERWAANFKRLPAGERLAILNKVLTADVAGDIYPTGTLADGTYGRRPDSEQGELFVTMPEGEAKTGVGAKRPKQRGGTNAD